MKLLIICRNGSFLVRIARKAFFLVWHLIIEAMLRRLILNMCVVSGLTDETPQFLVYWFS